MPALAAHDASRDDDIDSIIKIFTRVLQPEEEIGPDTDFFLAGGNSILAARAVASMRRSFTTTVSMRDILFGRTARALAGGLTLETVADRPYFRQ